jgi:phage terminase large subunit-like protein
LIEDTALGPTVASGLGKAISVIRVPRPEISKGERLRAVLPWIEARRIWLPDDRPWVLDFLAELMNFPSGGTDQVDMFTQYLMWRDGGNTAPPLRKPPLFFEAWRCASADTL